MISRQILATFANHKTIDVSMLGSLDNEVIFKKAFTDKFVFEHFVKDILNLDVKIGTIETEKRFTPAVGNIDFKLDIEY